MRLAPYVAVLEWYRPNGCCATLSPKPFHKVTKPKDVERAIRKVYPDIRD